MNYINLRSVDLNLLTIFNAIYTDGQTTKAAVTLGLTQPAVSHALTRLRALFDDPLFIRARTGMRPTPRAHEISDQINQILEDIREVVSGDTQFDPAAIKRELKIGMLDYGSTYFAPELGKILSVEAPGITVNCQQIQINAAVEQLDRGTLDMALAPFGTLPDRIERKVLVHEDYYMVARSNHPKLKAGLSQDIYADLHHVYISTTAEIVDLVDHELQSAGINRKIGMSLPHYSAALFAVSKSELVATVPKGPTELYREFLELDVFELPIKILPRVISVIRHRRTVNDPLINWVWNKFDGFISG